MHPYRDGRCAHGSIGDLDSRSAHRPPGSGRAWPPPASRQSAVEAGALGIRPIPEIFCVYHPLLPHKSMEDGHDAGISGAYAGTDPPL
eukprot:14212536-Heterocapsa_arctica.AAC.1